MTNRAVKHVDFVHTFIFILFALFAIIFARFYLVFLFPVLTIDSRPSGVNHGLQHFQLLHEGESSLLMAETTVPAWTSDRRARGSTCPVNRSRLCGQHKKPHKTGLLLIAKDLEEACGFSVLVARPKTMFTICCANVPPEIEPEFLTRYGNYVKNIYDKTIMIGRSYSARVSDVITRNSGNIYEIRMGELWEKYFSDMTFGMFKAKFSMESYLNRMGPIGFQTGCINPL